jgi:hypothetical protein
MYSAMYSAMHYAMQHALRILRLLRNWRLQLALALLLFAVTSVDGMRERRTLRDGSEVWWLALPGGYELDGQRTPSGWAVFWQTPEGESVKLVGGR